jgi:hypothetical protein
LDECCDKGGQTGEASVHAEQKHVQQVAESLAISKLPEPLEPAPSSVTVAKESPATSESPSAVPHESQCCPCKDAPEDCKDAPVEARAETVGYDQLFATRHSSASLPNDEQKACSIANDGASNEQAQLQRSIADSKPPPIEEASRLSMGKGAKIEVWSNSKQDWCPGLVVDFFEVECRDGGYKVPAGSYKVCYAGNTIKWIKPEHVQHMLRPMGTCSTV